MVEQSNVRKSKTTPEESPENSLKKLFENRDRARPGSKEEKQAAEKILEAIFPDTNAD
jgi:hypothetical protein